MNKIKVAIDYLPNVNYVLHQNKIPVCQYVEIHNCTTEPLTNIKVHCEGEFISRYDAPLIPQLEGGQTIQIDSFELSPDASQLASLTERISSNFTLKVSTNEETLYEQNHKIDLMAYDQWLGTTILPQTLVSFVTPNHPAIKELIPQIAATLKKINQESALTGYQTGNSFQVRQQVAAMFQTLHEQGIIYRGCPPSYEEIGQRITLPDQVLATKCGNCIELAVLMASILEAMEINSVIILLNSHAYLGVWLVNDSYSCSVCDDASFIEKKCYQWVNEMMVLECTDVTRESTTFETAIKKAQDHLADHSNFQMFIDVRRARLEKIIPLPMRTQTDGNWTFETTGVQHDFCSVTLEEHDRYDLSKLGKSTREITTFDIWERKLLDFSLRNSLLNLNLRRRAIQFISFDVDKVEDALQEGKEFCLEARPNIDNITIKREERLVRSKLYKSLYELIGDDINHQRLHTYQNENETKDILKNIYRAARNAIEEMGANSLFLTIGTLRWFETPQSETPRYAPLLLLPVEMIYKRGKYYIRMREETIFMNITLLEFLRQNYEIEIPQLNDLPQDESGVDVSLIFALIRKAVEEQRRWDIEEECILGVFSFSKFLMWNDIHSHRDKLQQNDIIKSLVEKHLTWTPEQITSDLKNIDEQASPTELALPMPIDSSQLAAVIEGGKGHSFILYGPPGTGKSQTITNLIANTLYQGKRVLFVAEKMAALSVVEKRLEQIGLDPFCLELHSNKATKRHVLQQLDKALKVTHIVSPAAFTQKAEKIFERRKELIAYVNALHHKDEADGLSLYECIQRYEAINAQLIEGFEYTSDLDAFLAKDGVEGLEDLLGERFDAIIKTVGNPATHPLKGLRVERSMLTQQNDLVISFQKSIDWLSKGQENYEELSKLDELREEILRNNTAEIFHLNAEELYQSWRNVNAKWFLPRYFAKRQFLQALRQYNKFISEAEVANLTAQLSAYQKKHSEVERIRQILEKNFGITLEENKMPEENILADCQVKLKSWSGHTTNMREWVHWSEYSGEMKANGLSCFIKAVESGDYSLDTIRPSFFKTLFRHKVETKIKQSDALAVFEGLIFDEKINSYKRMTEEFRELTKKELYARLANRIPRVTDNIDNSSEIGFLNRNISSGGRGTSLRDLFENLPTLFPRLCPCMLMSPMSVAQYLSIDKNQFDLVIFDEASQMPTSEAIGAIARGKALIVVGDPKQMPPTSFFSSTNVNEDEVCIDDMESILEDCRTLEIPSLQLSWHYRSRHESLIAFSNSEYYNSSLITFPSADDQLSKVKLIPIQGHYEKGGSRCNKDEANAIIQDIKRRLIDKNLRKKSIGVISFNSAQQGLIEDMLQNLLDSNKDLHDIAEAMHEPIFVKNLENVQGDERDVILFSIGYGPNKEGKISMNFGPLNNAGGERRLNVAVSRAREEMYIYSSLKATDIDLRRSKAKGVEGLKHFLEYAETQSLPISLKSDFSYQKNLVANQIASAMKNLGYITKQNVGRSKFKIDIAIADADNPNIYRLGILLDGERYRDTHTTRDREVVQPSVLKALNWKTMRIWSVDWYNNPKKVLNNIEEQLNKAEIQNEDEEARPKAFDVSGEIIDSPSSSAIEYTFYTISPQDAINTSMDELVKSVIQTEQPITFTYLCRRICALQGRGRITQSFQTSITQLLDPFYQDESGAIWMTKEDCDNFMSYRTNSSRDISDIPQAELLNVVREVLSEQISINMNALTLIAARKLGYTRRRTNVEETLQTAINTLSQLNQIEYIGENIRLKETNV